MILKKIQLTSSNVDIASSLLQSCDEVVIELSMDVQKNIRAEEVLGCSSLFVLTCSVELKNKFDGSLKILS